MVKSQVEEGTARGDTHIEHAQNRQELRIWLAGGKVKGLITPCQDGRGATRAVFKLLK